MINAIDEQQTIGHQTYWSMQADTHIVIRTQTHIRTHTHTHTHSKQTALTCSYCGGFACSTKLAYSDESSHAFGHANRSEMVHMVLRMPSSPDLLSSSSSSSVVPAPHRRLRPSSARRSSIRNRPAYLTDQGSRPLHACTFHRHTHIWAVIVMEVPIPGGAD